MPTIPQRIGFFTLHKTAYALCKALGKFAPGIVVLFPTNLALIAALEAAQAACNVLITEVEKVREPGV